MPSSALLSAKESRHPPRTRLETLRELLDDLQLRVVRLREQPPEDALAIPAMMDEAAVSLADLRETGSPVSSEETRFETIQAQFHKNRKLFLSRIGGAVVLAEARARQQPATENWWWFVDAALAAERRRTLLNLAAISGVLLVLLVVLAATYQRLWAPDPNLQAAVGWQTRAENALIAGEYQSALDAAAQSLALRPSQAETHLLHGVASEMINRPDDAEHSFAAAWALYPENGKDTFYAERAGYYLMAGQAVKALQDAENALSLNPESAMAFLRMAQAYELLGEHQPAIAAYKQAAETAKRNDNPQIEVIAKMGLAQLLQSPQGVQPTPPP